MDLGKVVIGYFAALGLGIVLVFLLTTLPALNGTVPPPSDQVVMVLWISIIVKLVFPVQLLLFLVGSVIGSAIGEHYFY